MQPYKGNCDTHCNMNLKDMRLSQRSQTQKDTVMIPFYEVPRGVRFIATENKMVGCQGLGVSAEGDRFSILQSGNGQR